MVAPATSIPAEVKALADTTYGALPANPHIGPRVRPQEPEQRAARRVELMDPRAGNASVRRIISRPPSPGRAGRSGGTLPPD